MRDIHALQMMSTEPPCVIKKPFYRVVRSTTMFTIKKLANTNENTDKMFLSVN